ncbi:MAG: glycosyltransferase family 39 protein [Acidobacteriia bacterium]|nr:glycosyltransferase family 39 protein [Terriglobia bacterium]
MPIRSGVSILALLLLALMFLLAGGAALRESVTIDEVAHIGAGVSYLQKLDLRYNEEHPPLAKVLAALPLVVRGTRADYSGIIWSASQDFFPAYLGEWVFGEYVLSHWNTPQSTLAWARLPMLLLTLALGWVVFAIARRLGGDWAGLLCLAVYAGTPVFLVFGPLVLTDIPITFFSLLALWAMADLWDDPNRKNTLLMSLALAGAILSKFTAPILFLVFFAVVLSSRWRPTAGQPAAKTDARLWRRLRWRAMRKATWWAALVVYAVYFLLSWNQPMDIPGLAGHGPLAALLGRLLMPPWLLLRGLAWVVITGNRPTFILGHAYPHGIWFYFPVLFVLKSPPGFLGLLAAALAVALIGKRLGWFPIIPAEFATLWRVLWVSLVVFAGICVVGHFDVSIRHFTIPLVLLILLLAPLPRLLGRIRTAAPKLAWASGALVVLLGVSCLVTVVRAYPYYFPYINPLGSGHPGYWLVNDSNLDWNQALPEVERFAREHGLKDVPIDIYGFSESTAFVPQSRLWDCQAPSDADAGLWAVVSANEILDAHNCIWLMEYPHEPLAGGSMFAVHLPATIPPCRAPGGPPPIEARKLFLGFPFEMRQVFQGLFRRPEDILRVMADMRANFEKQAQSKKK